MNKEIFLENLVNYKNLTVIKSEDVFVEMKAEHTTENLYYGCRMAEELGFKTIAFATQPAQSSFMKPFKRKFKSFMSDSVDIKHPVKLSRKELNKYFDLPVKLFLHQDHQ